jgi:hypothetical protein
MLGAIRRDFAEAIDRQDPAVGVASPQFAAMVTGSPVLTARGLEIMYLREQALGDAIAAEAGTGEAGTGEAGTGEASTGETGTGQTGTGQTGTGDVLHRVIAAQLAAIPRALFAEGLRLSMAGGSRADSLAALARHAERAFALLEPSLGGYGIRQAPATAGHGMS